MQSYNSKKDLLAIIQKYLEGKSSQKEKEFLELYYGFFEREDDLLNKLSEEEMQSLQETMEANILRDINQSNKAQVKVRKISEAFYKILAAASVLLIIGFVAFLYFNSPDLKNDGGIARHQNNQPLSKDKAILTLADGTEVSLDDAQNGELAEESGAIIKKLVDGSITYFVKDKQDKNQSLFYNTIATPNGSLYKINLPDETQVWLNAESSLKYPTSFNGKTRTVELIGEAYFEVAKNKNQPFIVKAKGAEVRVLGTQFNLSAYDNDDVVKTTLTEGSVLIKKNGVQKALKPGQQSVVDNASNNIEVKDVDVEEAMAWKNGYFIFNNEDIKTVMKMISRWYEIEVVYQGNIQNEVFIGTVSRFDNIEKLLKTIELTGGVTFKVENKPGKKERRVIVMP